MAEKDVPTILDEADVEYELLAHAHGDGGRRGQALGLDPNDVAKTLVLATPGGYVQAVLASGSSRPAQVREHVEGGKRIHLASEEDLKQDYSGFELGAVPPFGGSSDRVLVDSRLAERESVVLEAGSHEQSVRIRTADLLELTRAEVVDLARD